MEENKRIAWTHYFNEMQEYIKKNKTQHILISDEVYKNLRKWVLIQRNLYHKGKLRQDRIDLLNKIHFDFYPDNTSWDKWYDQLISFIQQHGLKKLTYKNKIHPTLGIWLYNQKRRYKKGTMPDIRLKRLIEAGIEWPNFK